MLTEHSDLFFNLPAKHYAALYGFDSNPPTRAAIFDALYADAKEAQQCYPQTFGAYSPEQMTKDFISRL